MKIKIEVTINNAENLMCIASEKWFLQELIEILQFFKHKNFTSQC